MIARPLLHAGLSIKSAGILALALFLCPESQAPGAESAGKADGSKPAGNGRSAAILLQQALTAAKATSDADQPLERADLRGVPAKTPADSPGLLPSPDAFPDDARAAASQGRTPPVPAPTNKPAPSTNPVRPESISAPVQLLPPFYVQLSLSTTVGPTKSTPEG
jgi:hypothetical protein